MHQRGVDPSLRGYPTKDEEEEEDEAMDEDNNDEDEEEDDNAGAGSGGGGSDDSDDSDDDSSDEDDDEEGGGDDAEEDNEEGDDEDDLLKSFRLAKQKKESDKPGDIDLSSDCADSPSTICFHQSEDVLAVGTFNGGIRIYSYSNNEGGNELKASASSTVGAAEGQGCRELTYSADGDKLFAAFTEGNDLIIYDVKDGLREERRIRGATKDSVSSLYTVDEHTLATGDDDGHVMLWDLRSKKSYASFKVSEDPISSIISNHEKRILACTSTDGSLYAIKVRGGGSVMTESEEYDTEFNCIGLFKQESKLAIGSGNGSVYVFNWNEFGKHADIYTGISKKKKSGINSLIPITERIILTGDDDGYIRAWNFYPQKYLGLVGKMPGSSSVEKMDICNDGHLIATIGSDEDIVKFWNVSYFDEMEVKGEKAKKNVAKPPRDEEKRSNLPSSSGQNARDFYKGLL